MKILSKHIKAANMYRQALFELQNNQLNQKHATLQYINQKSSEIPKLCSMHSKAINRGWKAASGIIGNRAKQQIEELSACLENSRHNFNTAPIIPARLSSIVAELSQLESEFGLYTFNYTAKTISVFTESITLEGVNIGSFEICLAIDDIKYLPNQSPYSVIAQNPNPARTDSGVTHPHVSNQKLCEGDGYNLIRKALTQGRLNDFFIIVDQTLQTYNPDSPFVSLEDWQGQTCHDCGDVVASDDQFTCIQCGKLFCEYCTTGCHVCDETICLSCYIECTSCNEKICKHGSNTCIDCQNTVCESCITEDSICPSCNIKQKENNNENDQNVA